MSRPLIELVGVSKTYASAATQQGLSDVSITIDEGDFVAIVGPSGAGKSTLLNVVGLLDTPTAGQYFIAGQDTKLLSSRQRDQLRAHTFGFVFQDAYVIPEDTVARNAALGLRTLGFSRARQSREVTDALTRLGIRQRAGQLARYLSGGERQRLAIARALTTRPTILLADEPTGNLDSHNTKAVVQILLDLNRAGTTIVLITHDLEVAEVATRRLSITDGRVTEIDGPPSSSNVGSQRPDQGGTSPERKMRQGRAGLEALASLTLKPLRSVLLTVAFVLGIGGLIASLGISQSAAQQVSERLSAAALDEVSIKITGTASSIPTEEEQRSAITKISPLPGVVGAAIRVDVPATSANVSVLPPGSFDEQPVFGGRVLGFSGDFFSIDEVSVNPARAATVFENPFWSQTALVGEDAAIELGISDQPLGKQIWVGGQRVTVVGTITGSTRDPLLARAIVLPAGPALSLNGADSSIVVRTVPGYPAPLSEAIPLAIDPGNPASVKTSTVADLRSLRRGVSTDLGSLVAVVSWLLLVLGSLAASTVMYLSVVSRTQEIALRRSFGASKSVIRKIFMVEGLLIGLAGGLAGAAIGLFATVIVCSVQGWDPVLSWNFLGIGLLAGLVTGGLSSIFPAMQAASINPAQALRN